MNAAAPNENPSFEAAMEEVQNITQQLRDGNVAVDGMLEAAERGRWLIGHCESLLRNTETKLQPPAPPRTVET